MPRFAERMRPPTIAVLGGTGRFGAPFVHEFLDQGLTVRLLARSPEKVAGRFPTAHVCRGSMLNLAHVKRAMHGSSAALLITPVGGNDDERIELTAAECAIKAARTTCLPHLIYLSLIQPWPLTGVPMLDVKGRIESMLEAGGLPFSSLRTGCYMDAWLAFVPIVMRLGVYPMPVGPRHRFSFTAQRDVARLAVLLIRRRTVVGGSLDVIDPTARSIDDLLALYRTAKGRKPIPVGRWLIPVLTLLRPVLFRWLYPQGASRITLLNFFNTHDWIGDPGRLAEGWPEFRVTSMEDYLRGGTRDAGQTGHYPPVA